MTPIINNCLSTNIYPDYTKRAEVTPLYKKSDRLAKENYRPLSILTSTSKIFEGILCDQYTTTLIMYCRQIYQHTGNHIAVSMF